MINICETFKSIQGESTHAGRVCSFVRLSGCNLSCSYCDTRYAFTESRSCTIDEIMQTVESYQCKLVEITGGEPLMQSETPQLCKRLIDKGYTVLIETNGSYPIDLLPGGCIRIVDVKCPGSGESGSFLLKNIELLEPDDEIKFVISSVDDFNWSVDFVKRYNLERLATILFSPDLGKIASSELASWILEKNVPVRLGLQLHKLIWGDKRGV
jgi:7-carboxy-7-deazaguanine synthase